jgi:poly(ADP-ribose) glycohydrolase ARH3
VSPKPRSRGADRFRAAARRPAGTRAAAARTDRARGALLGTFVGDALGMPFEGALPAQIPAEIEMEDGRLGRGTYTDDTQMMIALGESLLRCETIEAEDLSRSFRAHFEPARGYGAGTAQVIGLWEQGEPAESAALRIFDGEGSLGNGAAMRVAPVAVRFSDDDVLLRAQARHSARLTHAHRLGIDGAVVQAAAIGAALEDDDAILAAVAAAETRELREALTEAATPRAADGIPSSALRSVPVAIMLGAGADSFEAAVRSAVALGGDTDTVAAMAGAIAGARFGVAGIPARWLDALEDGAYGRRHVEELADQLVSRAASAVSGALPRRD